MKAGSLSTTRVSREQLREWLKTLQEPLGHLRHAIACRYRDELDHTALRKLPNANLPAMSGQSSRSHHHLSAVQLNDRQIEIISRAAPKRDYYCHRRGNRLFELGLGEVALALTAASSKSDRPSLPSLSPPTTARISHPRCSQGCRLGRRSFQRDSRRLCDVHKNSIHRPRPSRRDYSRDGCLHAPCVRKMLVFDELQPEFADSRPLLPRNPSRIYEPAEPGADADRIRQSSSNSFPTT